MAELPHFLKQRHKTVSFLPIDRAKDALSFYAILSLLNWYHSNKISTETFCVTIKKTKMNHKMQREKFSDVNMRDYYQPELRKKVSVEILLL